MFFNNFFVLTLSVRGVVLYYAIACALFQSHHGLTRYVVIIGRPNGFANAGCYSAAAAVAAFEKSMREETGRPRNIRLHSRWRGRKSAFFFGSATIHHTSIICLSPQNFHLPSSACPPAERNSYFLIPRRCFCDQKVPLGLMYSGLLSCTFAWPFQNYEDGRQTLVRSWPSVVGEF